MLTERGQRYLPVTGQRRAPEAESDSDRGIGGAGEHVHGPWPLTHAQCGLWIQERAHPASSLPAAVNAAVKVALTAVRLRGPLDSEALRRALGDCVERQEALRARFVTLGGRPFQVFVPERPLLPLVEVPDADAVAARCEELAGSALDPRSGPPLRAELLRLGPEHHVLALAVHRAVYDDRSERVLLAELGTAYGDRLRGTAPHWMPLDASFGELARRQRRSTADGAYTREQVAHWRNVLRGASCPELPANRPRPPERTFAAATVTRALDARTTAGVRELARRLAVPARTVLLAAFTHLLSRVMGGGDVIVGLTVASRTAPEAHAVVGCFAGPLPLRVRPAGAGSFTELVERHREPLDQLARRQDFPLHAVVDAVGARDEPDAGGRAALFDVRFDHHCDPVPGLSFTGLDSEPVGVPPRYSLHDLSWDVTDRGDRTTIRAGYSTELFDEATIASFADGFLRIVRQAVEDPDTLPEPYLSAPEPTGRDTAAPWTVGGLAGVVAEQAAMRPDAPALRYGRRMMTFRQLDCAADRMASRITGALEGQGAGPGTAVALLTGPSAQLPAAMLGVLRAGAVYVPIDPALPPRRAAAMAVTAGCRLVVCDGRTQASAASLGLPLLRVDGRSEGGAAPPVRLTGRITPSTPGYVIFTSGSTGRPKAVLVPHGAALALASSAALAYELGPDDVALQSAPVGADVSVEEFFASWRAGACVAVPEPDETADLDILISRHRATVLNLPPALWHPWVRRLCESGERVREPVRLVVVGSDRVDPEAVRVWHDGVGRGIRLLNAYGTTETTVTSTTYDTCELPADADATSGVPIGRPLPHVSVYVLDGRLRPVRPSMPGELWIGGAGVALGYLDDPVATAERFRPDPFSGRPGSRMYRTGDRVRVLASGALDFLGRIDSQVKVGGLRVELEEVERVAREVPGVADFAADVRPDATGTGMLVGYVLAPPGTPAPAPTARYSAPHDGALDCAAMAPDDQAALAALVTARWERIPPGGELTVRSVRDLTTLHAFHTAALAAGADGESDAAAFATAVDEAVEGEDGLCLHPWWFTELAAGLCGPVGVTVRPAPALPGEPPGHRFDVTLTRSATAPPSGRSTAVSVDGADLDASGLERLLRGLSTTRAVVIGLRDGRTAAAAALAGESASGRHRTVEQARRAAAGVRAVHPARAVEIAASIGRTAVPRTAADGRFDLLLGSGAGHSGTARPAPGTPLANDPARGGRSARLRAAVREHLRTTLPAPMVPARLLVVDNLPRTPSGKVDRRRLPSPRRAVIGAGAAAAEPRDRLERQLCRLWAEVLGLASVGVHDNFFELDGDSLAWTQITAVAAERSGIALSAPDVFDHPTVRELAALVRARGPHPRTGQKRPG